ncbi:MAG: hypothetical protein D6765_00090, partial [Bacteroidetes bacterium]
MLFPCLLTAQKEAVPLPFERVFVDGAQSRVPLEVQGEHWRLEVCGLEAGADYDLSVNRHPCEASIGLAGAEQGERSLQVRAEGECLLLDVWAGSGKEACGEELWLSVGKRVEREVGGLRVVSVSQDNANNLVQNVLIGGTCFNVSNVTSQGSPTAIGSFSGGANSIGFSDGMVMATGNINQLVPGPNNDDG